MITQAIIEGREDNFSSYEDTSEPDSEDASEPGKVNRCPYALCLENIGDMEVESMLVSHKVVAHEKRSVKENGRDQGCMLSR